MSRRSDRFPAEYFHCPVCHFTVRRYINQVFHDQRCAIQGHRSTRCQNIACLRITRAAEERELQRHRDPAYEFDPWNWNSNENAIVPPRPYLSISRDTIYRALQRIDLAIFAASQRLNGLFPLIHLIEVILLVIIAWSLLHIILHH